MSSERSLAIFDGNGPLYIDLLREALQTEWRIEIGPSSTEWLSQHIASADAAIGSKLPPELLPFAQRLKLLLFPGAGYMHRNPEELPEGCQHAVVFEHEIPIAEYIFWALLKLATGLEDTASAFRRGEWLGNGRIGGIPHRELYGSKLGLIGYGHIGQEIARRAEVFGLSVQSVRSDHRPEELHNLLATSDFVVVACPLTPRTEGLLGAAELRLLAPHAVLVNIARAEIIQEDALFEALRDKWFAGAALDVWYRYPTRNDELLHGSRYPFHELPSVLVTPHSSAWTQPLIARRAKQIAANLDRFARGEPLERVVLTGSWRPA